MLKLLPEFKRVKQVDLVPCQQSTKLAFQKKCDFHLQQFIKHPLISEFHSYAEKLHACLLEATPSVSCFVPQPTKLIRAGKRYTPDCYYCEDGIDIYVEIKPEARMEEFDESFWSSYFQFKGAQFRLISNESIFAQETLALNWLGITKTLLDHQHLDTQSLEYDLLDRLVVSPSMTLEHIVNSGDRNASLVFEVALFRLAHLGHVMIQCDRAPLNWNTKVVLR